jgi:hypothetical protein
MTDFQRDLHLFIDGLAPTVRERFVIQTRMVLEDACRYFGNPG